MILRRVGPIGIAIAIVLVVSLLLAAIFCAFPWSMVCTSS